MDGGNLQEKTDNELMGLAAADDRDAFETLVLRHYREAMRAAERMVHDWMLAASLLGLCFNGAYILVLFLRYRADGIRLMAVSFSSLACFSVLLLAELFCFPQSYGELLRRVPVYLFLGAGLAGVCLYVRQLAFLTTLVFRKEYTDVAN